MKDAKYYLEQLQRDTRRHPDSQQLQIVEEADHMFKGQTQAVVTMIVKWYAHRKAFKLSFTSLEGRL